jgi:hypothetical protein
VKRDANGENISLRLVVGKGGLPPLLAKSQLTCESSGGKPPFPTASLHHVSRITRHYLLAFFHLIVDRPDISREALLVSRVLRILVELYVFDRLFARQALIDRLLNRSAQV